MEKELSNREKLISLLKTAISPFSSDEKIADILSILKNSKSYGGLNHLILIDDYLNENKIFCLTKEEAILEANKAIEENNNIGYYYLYRLTLDEDKNLALSYLYKIIDSSYPKADLAYADHLLKGDIVLKDEKKAFKYYQIAASFHLKEGYYGMLYILEKNNKIEEAEKLYKKAKEEGIDLPGVVI